MPPADPAPLRVVVIGAGFSGAVTAVQLLRQSRRRLEVVLVDDSTRMARGLAYGTRNAEHVLNVPAGNMSALADDADDFLHFVRRIHPSAHAGSFVPRPLYGAYLESLLLAADSAGTPPGTTFSRVAGTAVRIDPPGAAGDGVSRARVHLGDGRVLDADRIVLALGHQPPAAPLDDEARRLLGDAYIGDPWHLELDRRIAPDHRVLLIGSGLTALDVIISLAQRGHHGALVCVSRRGLQPLPHRTANHRPPAVDGAGLVRAMGPGLRQQVRVLRRQIADAMRAGGDWRDWIAALRPHMPAWWAALPLADRRRFLRHLQPYWDVVRHRCAPTAHARMQALVEAGQLRFVAARLGPVQVCTAGRAAGFEVTLLPRAGGAPQHLGVDRIVNCTGPSGRIADSASPLVRHLMAAGRLMPDALAIGVAVAPDGALLDAAGARQPWLRYIGPLLKARDWEAVAVPELRVLAAELARALLDER